MIVTPDFGLGPSGMIVTPDFGLGPSGIIDTPLFWLPANEIAMLAAATATTVMASERKRLAVRDILRASS